MSRKPPFFDTHRAKYEDANSVGLSRSICFYVSDGDTSDFLLDLGWYQYAYVALRFLGINTPEMHGTSGDEKGLAEKAKSRVRDLILLKPVLIRSFKDRTTFERFVGQVYFIPESEDQFSYVKDVVSVSNKRWYSVIEILIAEGLGAQI